MIPTTRKEIAQIANATVKYARRFIKETTDFKPIYGFKDVKSTEFLMDEAARRAIALGGAPVKMFYQENLERIQSAHLAQPKCR